LFEQYIVRDFLIRNQEAKKAGNTAAGGSLIYDALKFNLVFSFKKSFLEDYSLFGKTRLI